jgi:hypothetical protein
VVVLAVTTALRVATASAAPPSATRHTVEGWPWPEIATETRVAASPAEVVAVYADVSDHSAWAPNIVASRVVERIAPNVVRVAYEYEVPGPNGRSAWRGSSRASAQ